MAKKILIVEDDPAVRFTLRFLLELEGYEVITASNGRDGLRFLAAEVPSAVLLDLIMPVADGWQFLEEQRKHQTLSKIPVALISGYPESSRTLRTHAYLPKPLCLDRVLEAVGRLCA